ncbi:hypothetical protein GLOTRDRAFT_44887 [Gloeophyllum trabeum ATCC 11539]|uniref:BTB domain-containing protein n=1 Tax=Gloeophyllum trabeum (strain ATCC 11539 / FP-39264 / Madison 617) TaxID=670483 RepID=S7Q2M6_GLOTA|nr:uncharacterized protein GLOTRDRAFT_44887 [Gloeophyllum trabeum ATCC 11539]EPQ53807.1 hypothetical protein GLOTRDRAFT_44887 [Gloeophyllum trabeum ATCC 11539]
MSSPIGSYKPTPSTSQGRPREKPTYGRCQELWFEDGNVIFQAQRTFFRVHRGVLSANSSVFRDMFSFPQPATVNIVPEVELHDTAKEVEHFFKTIFIAGYYDKRCKSDFEVVAAVLRLSTKYDVPSYRQRAIRQLALIYPTTLDGWDARNRRSDLYSGFIEQAAAVVGLARETHVRALIPSAMYTCCEMGTGHILKAKADPAKSILGLSSYDRRCCLLGRQKLVTAWRSEVFSRRCLTPDQLDFFAWFEGPKHEMCHAARLKWLAREDVWKMAFGTEWCNPLQTLWPQTGLEMCAACDAAFIANLEHIREQIWEKLPSHFGFSDWTTVREELKECLQEEDSRDS